MLRAGRNILKEIPDTPGSLGMAISEAVEAAVSDQSGQTRYSLGSVLNHVLLHQTIIGLEAKKQLAGIGEKKVDVVVGCAGGGSNFAGLSFPFISDKIEAKEEGKEKVIIMNWSDHGLMDLTGYQAFLEGKLKDYPLPDEELQKSLNALDNLPKPSLDKSGKW